MTRQHFRSALPKLALWAGSLAILLSFPVAGGCAKKSEPINFVVRPLKAGGDISLASEFKDKPVVIYVWATWCGPCKMFAPILNEIADEYQKKGIGFFAVASDEIAKVRQYEIQNPHRMTVGIDNQMLMGSVLDVHAIPVIAVVDKSHRVVWQQSGVDQKTPEQLIAILSGMVE